MVQNGLDHLQDAAPWLRNRRLGLITSVSGVTREMESGIEKIHRQFPLTALFGPEHGVRGDHTAGEDVGDYTDPETGLPVYSLYSNSSKSLTPEMLQKVDTMVYDIQDVGLRFYTFISTLLYALRDCAAAGKELVVLDRVNPLGAVTQGGVLQAGFESFVGPYQIPARYGLTAGELAVMVNEKEKIGCNLHVLPVRGWKREQLYPETGYLWMMPSPALPNFETALLYSGSCLFEGTTLSEGRGTSCPFSLIGAPYINGSGLAREMNALHLPGIIFTPAYFTPTASKYAGLACSGVHMHVSDMHSIKPIEACIALLYKIRELYPNDFAVLPSENAQRPHISLLAGSDVFEKDWPEQDSLLNRWAAESTAFSSMAQAYHLYE